MSAICQSKVQELGELNQALRNRDKMKDDAIAHLSNRPFKGVHESSLLSLYLA